MSTDHKSEALHLAQRLTQGWGLELAQDAAAELRRLAAVEAERDDLKQALAHTVRLVQDWQQSSLAMQAQGEKL